MSQGFAKPPVTDFGIVTVLPTVGLRVGDRCVFQADANDGIFWQLIYEGVGTYKWKFIGGPPLSWSVDAQEINNTSAGVYHALATAGPAVTVPRAGDYVVRLEGNLQVAAGTAAFMSYDIGGTGAVTDDCIDVYATGGVAESSCSRSKVKTLAASTVLTCKYMTMTGAATYFQKRSIAITPVRVI